MRYRIYLHIPSGSAFERTETGSRSIAELVFKAILERDEFVKTEVSVQLLYQRNVFAIQRFDAALGTLESWQGR